MKKDSGLYIFRLDAYTPDTIPMSRLAEYLKELAGLMGHDSHVHLAGIAKGSVKIKFRVDAEDEPEVDERIKHANDYDAPTELRSKIASINRLLLNDNAIGTIRKHGAGVIIKFPGRNIKEPDILGPIKELGSLEGKLIRVGGKDRTIHMTLIGPHDEEFKLETTNIETAKGLGKLLFEEVRVSGIGTWIRDETSEWTLQRFQVQEFEPLSDESLIEAVAGLRSVGGDEWRNMDDPLATWRDLRNG
jgi:hypothetical protein